MPTKLPFCLYYKMLERGRFPWPAAKDGCPNIGRTTKEILASPDTSIVACWLLSCLNCGWVVCWGSGNSTDCGTQSASLGQDPAMLSEQDIGLKVLIGQDAQIDTTTAAGRLSFSIFAALAEFES